jgi:hypothetical protein
VWLLPPDTATVPARTAAHDPRDLWQAHLLAPPVDLLTTLQRLLI